MIRNVGEAFGEFQMLLQDLDARRLYATIPDFHNTWMRYKVLKKDATADSLGRIAEVRQELDWLLSVEDLACTLTDLEQKEELPHQLPGAQPGAHPLPGGAGQG